MESPASGRHERALSWAILLGLVTWLAITWYPGFSLPFGDSHEGRILSEFGIRVRNFWEMGPAASSWGGDWSPFSYKPYNHWPPLLHSMHVLNSWVFGQGQLQLKSIGYLSGLLTVPALAYMGRRSGLRPVTAALATALVVVTPFFWLYARVGLGMLPLALMAGTLLHLAATPKPSRWLIGAGAAASFFAVTSSWQGVVLGAFLGLWLLRKRRIDRATLTVGITMAISALIVFVWINTGPGVGDLVEWAGVRVRFPWTLKEFLDRQWYFAEALLPDGYEWLLLAALPIGLVHRKTRFITWVFALLMLGFMFGPSDNAWIHDYWNFYGFLAVVPAVGILIDLLAGEGRRRLVVSALVVLLALVWVGEIRRDTYQERYFDAPAAAGFLLQETSPAPGQERGWYLNPIPHLTWMSYYWDLPTGEVTPDMLDTVPEGDLVLLRTDRLPSWLSPEVTGAIVAENGRYAFVPAGALRAHVLETGADA